MNSIRKSAENELHAKTKKYMADHNVKDYRAAWNIITMTNPERFHQYLHGDSALKIYEGDTLSPAQKEMAVLLADPGKTMTLAGFALDRLARQKVVNVGPGVADPAGEYRRALASCKEQYPNLARAASDGFLGDRDFATLALLVPSLAKEVEEGRYSRKSTDRCPHCGENKAYCNGRKLAEQRGVDEHDMKAFEQCILDAREFGDSLDEIRCYY